MIGVSSPRGSDVFAFAVGGVVAVGLASIGAVAMGHFGDKANIDRAAILCCLRSEKTADMASAVFQQTIASAIVQAGSKIKGFSSPRPALAGHYRQLTTIVSVQGSDAQIQKALSNLAEVQPRLAVAKAEFETTPSGDVRLSLLLAQWADN